MKTTQLLLIVLTFYFMNFITFNCAAQCNVALNQPATASGTYTTYTPDKAFDGSTLLSSKWVQGGGAPGWIQVDLGAQYTIDNIQLVVEQIPDGNTVHEIYTSPDMSAWTLVETISQYTSQSQVLSLIYSPQLTSVQGVKVVTTTSPSWIAWREIEVNTCAALPIQLLSFDATPIKDNNNKYYVRCNWITATEINNDYFTVERSQDGKTFAHIGKVDGAGNSSNTLYYEFDDWAPYSGLSYYRHKQTDYDGKYSYSNIVAVYIGEMDIINISPSPAEKEIEYIIKISETATAQVKVINVLGQEVIHTTETIEKGVTQKKLDISMLASGYYMLSINTERLGTTEKKFAVK